MKTDLDVFSTFESIYTGGSCILAKGGHLLTSSTTEIFSTTFGGPETLCLDANGNEIPSNDTRKIMENGKSFSQVLLSLNENNNGNGEMEISCFAIKDKQKNTFTLVVALQNCLLQIYHVDSEKSENDMRAVLFKQFKVHEAPVLTMDFDPTGTLIATGSADSTIKVWDVEKGHATHNFKGHSGIVSVVKFHPDPKKLLLASGSDDCKVRVWDLRKKNCLAVLDGHVSVIRGLSYTMDGAFLFSAGRDKMFSKWNLQDYSLEMSQPIFESIEAIQVVQFGPVEALCTAGEKGLLKFWATQDGQLIHEQVKDIEPSFEISQLLYDKNQLAAITSDQNIVFYDIQQGNIVQTKQLAGYNQEILDLSLFGENDSHLAVITNSEQIRVYNIDSKDCQIVYGHSDIVLSVALSFDRKLLITGAKDNTAKLWNVDENNQFQLLHEFIGHNGPVSAVAMSRLSNKVVLTASQDRTIKSWTMQGKTNFTFQAHENDIQAIDIAPNDSCFASASLDKSIKLWSMQDGNLLGTFKGHKRGVWSVKFSPVDQALATCSTDKTIKLWNIRDFSCIRTFEGHLNTVLNIKFISLGMQLVSSGSDGLVKIWNTADGECVNTFDNHEDRIWALEVSKDESFIFTGSSDSTITVWKDVTEQVKIDKQKVQDEKMDKEQDLAIFLKRKDYKSAIILAMQLDQPFKILGIFTKVMLEKPDKSSCCGSLELDEYLSNLAPESLEKMLLFIRDWNTHSKHARVAQNVLNIILKNTLPEDLLSLPKAKEIFESLVSYSDRHMSYTNQLIQDNYMVDYTLEKMDSLL